MALTVFGGTGPTGLLLIEQALAAGHRVTAVARTPSKLRETRHSGGSRASSATATGWPRQSAGLMP